jgi:hypothetical protein
LPAASSAQDAHGARTSGHLGHEPLATSGPMLAPP